MVYVSPPPDVTSTFRVTVAGSSRNLVDDVVTVGRDARAPTSLPHPDISRRHAELRRTPPGWRLGSTNGTLVGNRPATGAARRAGPLIPDWPGFGSPAPAWTTAAPCSRRTRVVEP